MASETEHTPGPWACFYKSKYDEWHVSLPMAGGGMKLALCPDGIQSENREADARLIAAAPDMLAALEEIRDMPVMNPVAVYEIARAAIAKATS